jgi:16S rRNA (cytosine1402-N4)-methyltransferase
VPTRAHTPVLVREVREALAPAVQGAKARATEAVFVDATCGFGGHALALVRASRPTLVVLVDRDPSALSAAATLLSGESCPVTTVHSRFSRIAQILAERRISRVAAILADLGVSSYQLDTATRGFSFSDQGPLDMRMDPTCGATAADLLGSMDEEELARVLRDYGEEPDAARIARAVVKARPRTTCALAATIETAMSPRERERLRGRIHPATRSFQAIRMLVNDEPNELDALLRDGPELLARGGRLAVITFHSLEDRPVKRRFRSLAEGAKIPAGVPVRHEDLPPPRFCIPPGYRSGMTPDESERERNIRSRSARMRVLERCAP